MAPYEADGLETLLAPAMKQLSCISSPFMRNRTALGRQQGQYSVNSREACDPHPLHASKIVSQ
jgi:hypothetical protein